MNQPHGFSDDDDTTPFVRTAPGPQPVARTTTRPPAPVQTGSGADTLWDTNDVARYLKVSRSWVYHRAEAGLMPHLRVGGLLRFDPDVVRVFARKK